MYLATSIPPSWSKVLLPCSSFRPLKEGGHHTHSRMCPLDLFGILLRPLLAEWQSVGLKLMMNEKLCHSLYFISCTCTTVQQTKDRIGHTHSCLMSYLYVLRDEVYKKEPPRGVRIIGYHVFYFVHYNYVFLAHRNTESGFLQADILEITPKS